MAAIIPTYIPCPNWDILTTSPLVKLGGLIRDPKNPESRVPRSVPPPIPDDAIHNGTKTDWQTTSTELLSGKLGIWAQCLQIVGLGGDLSFKAFKNSFENHKFECLETKYFLPDDNFIEESLKDEFVQGYFEVYGWRKPVYMITGIKIARRPSVESSKTSELGVDGNVGADLTSVGVPVTLGHEGGWERERKRTLTYAGSTDYIFAYQLKRIRARKGGKPQVRDHVKGALFGRNDYEEEEDGKKSLHEVYEIDDFDGVGEGILDELKEVTTDKDSGATT